MILKNCNIVLPSSVFHGDIKIEKGYISEIAPSIKGDGIDYNSSYILPGFIDIHVHGGGGCDFMDGEEEAFIKISEFHLKHGTVALCPTTLTSDFDELKKSFEIYHNVKNKCRAELLGMHLEGPYVSMNQLGAQDPKYAHISSDNSYYDILDSANGAISIWTIAPELEGSLELIKEAIKRRVKISLGHSDATINEVLLAEKEGASMVTHLFSSMSTIKRCDGVRVPGVLESALISETLRIEMIADGMHVPPSLIKLVLKCVPEDNLILITDAMRGAGQEDGESILGSKKRGQTVIIRDGVARMPDGISFAGSIATTDRLLRTMVQSVGLPIEKAARMLALNPSIALGIEDRYGIIDIGRRADLVIMDTSLNVLDVLLNGKSIKG